MADSRLRFDRASVEEMGEEAAQKLKILCTHQNPRLQQWYKHKNGFRPKEHVSTWRKVRKDEGGGFTLPRGRILEVEDALPGLVIEDRTVERPVPKRVWMGPAPWGFQERFVRSYLAGGPEIWRAPPGSGKTLTVLQLFAALGQKTLVVAPNDAVFQQWVSYARQFFGFEPGLVKGGKHDERPDLVVASQRTLWKRMLGEEYGLVVFDEAQLCAANTYQTVIDRMTARYRLAVSGEEHRSDQMEFLIYDQFGPDIDEVTREELLEAGTLVDVEVRVALTNFDAPWWRELTDEQRAELEEGEDEWEALASSRFHGRHRLMAEMAACEARNRVVLACAEQCLREGEQVALLSRTRDHCLRLEGLLEGLGVRTVRLMGDDRDFERQRGEFARGEARAAVGTYGKIGVGFESHRELARGVFALPVVSNALGRMQFDQFRGRFARAAAGKQRAVVWYVHDPLVFGDKAVKLLTRWASDVRVLVDGELVSAALYLRRKRGKTNHAKSTATRGARPAAAAPTAATRQRGFWD